VRSARISTHYCEQVFAEGVLLRPSQGAWGSPGRAALGPQRRKRGVPPATRAAPAGGGGKWRQAAASGGHDKVKAPGVGGDDRAQAWPSRVRDVTLEARGAFHRQLDELDIAFSALLDLIPDALRRACSVLDDPGRHERTTMAHWRQLVRDLYDDTERSIEGIVARQAPVAGDLRFLLGCLRLAPLIQDTIDTLVDIADLGCRGWSAPLSGPLQVRIDALVRAAGQLWEDVRLAWVTHDHSAELAEAGERARLEVGTFLDELGRAPLDARDAAALGALAQLFLRLATQAQAAAAVITAVNHRRSADAH
jgi:hypothetical protein